ncbi:16S rRNA (adenine(1518)-N(6)/adenine(1519)-N(6))-dimethyltransferase RsmA [Candidatus Nanohalovita haloferacivicina]|uniref:16S rRNA (adenine(1518)-N(6)/adenine(1519)-N(6))- dimethyltransferase RsmA n=1 Tax=Candidatus Nanohalovita haloferacivicina TaxID=2978046 RepID=UPI00325FB652|nr:16S rRNA (adenine1518-N6/adenine1519-N6)-dimethyltransferase [Candidatus Nanohalobia archaeon BNXNv]
MKPREELQKLGVRPVEGQNFLNSQSTIKALVEAGEIDDKTVLEIGAGTGSITRELSEKAEKVYAVESDTTLANHVKGLKLDNVEVINENILEYEIPEEIERCVGNIPFQISSEILDLLGEKQIQSSLLVQKELAEKAVADPGDKNYGYFSVRINYYFVPVKLRNVPSRNFHPSPDVDGAILKLYPNKQRHGIKDEETFLKVAKALFTHKRKKIRNSFVDVRHILDIEKDRAKELRDQIPHSEKRVINLTVKEIAEIAEFYQENFNQ